MWGVEPHTENSCRHKIVAVWSWAIQPGAFPGVGISWEPHFSFATTSAMFSSHLFCTTYLIKPCRSTWTEISVFIYRHRKSLHHSSKNTVWVQGYSEIILHLINRHVRSTDNNTFSAYPLPTDYRNHGVVLSPRTKFLTYAHSAMIFLQYVFRRNRVAFYFPVCTGNNLDLIFSFQASYVTFVIWIAMRFLPTVTMDATVP